MEEKNTTIAISKKTKEKLDKLVENKQDTYEDIINRLLEIKEKTK